MLVHSEVVYEVNDDFFPVSEFPRGFELLLLFSLPNAFADNDKEEDNTLERKWFLTVYGGLHAQKTLGGLLTFQATFPDDTYIAVAALGREFWRYKQLSLERMFTPAKLVNSLKQRGMKRFKTAYVVTRKKLVERRKLS